MEAYLLKLGTFGIESKWALIKGVLLLTSTKGPFTTWGFQLDLGLDAIRFDARNADASMASVVCVVL